MVERAELDKIIHRKVLANGLEAIVVENHGVPLATVEIVVRNGSFTQPPDYSGLSHLYEHMFFRSNDKYPENRRPNIIATYNGTTREEQVNYFMTLQADSIRQGLDFMAAALRWPSFRQDELEREREVVIGEYDRQESTPYFQLTQKTTALLYPGNFSRKNTIGDRDVILATTPEKMREIQRRYYVPNNTAVIISGDINPDSAISLIEKEFNDWPRAADPFVAYPIPPIPSLKGNQALIVEGPVTEPIVQLQWQGPSVLKDPVSTYAADVFSDVLNAPGSTLQRRLVDSGLWRTVGVNYYTLNNVGPITISGQPAPGKFREAVAVLKAEISKFDDPGYFSQEELEAQKAHRAVTSAFDRERGTEFSHTLGFWWSVASLEYYMGYVDNMATRNLEDLRNYARKYIIGKPMITGVLIDPDTRAKLKLTEKELQ